VNRRSFDFARDENSVGSTMMRKAPVQQPLSMEVSPFPFVIPSEAEGSAVLLNQQPRPMEVSPFALSSRAKPRDLRFAQPATEADGSVALSFVIPSEAEGSAVCSTSNQGQSKRRALLAWFSSKPHKSVILSGAPHRFIA
jgi:hypothetical protein